MSLIRIKLRGNWFRKVDACTGIVDTVVKKSRKGKDDPNGGLQIRKSLHSQ